MKKILNLAAALILINSFISAENYFTGNNWKIIIADKNEKGESIIVTGTIYSSDGNILPGVTVHVYHTDSDGYYSRPGDSEKYRLYGTMITNSDGRYEYSTIKPAPYPNGNIPAHVHYKISGTNISEQWFELHFEGDPYISPKEFEKESEKGTFSSIQKPAEDNNGTLRFTFDIKLK